MTIKNIEDLKTPCYIVKEGELQKCIDSFQKSLDRYFVNNVLSYSLKTNSAPYVLRKILNSGGYAEVVSYDEYSLARLVGFPINKIVYNGPLKSLETFREALENGAFVNIETKQEIEWLKKLDQSKVYNVGIRLNIDLKIVSPNDAKDEEDYSRFGFSMESGEFVNALEQISDLPYVKLTGIHVHRTSKTRSVDVFGKIAAYVGKIIQKQKLTLDYLDIGGGYYGIMEGKPTFDQYMDIIHQNLAKYLDVSKTTIIVEPGNAIVASAFDFLTTIIDHKKIRDFIILTTDGSRNDIDPFYQKKSYFYELIKGLGFKERINIPLQKITGCTCLEYDKLFDLIDCEEFLIGDKILYKSVGAYTMALSPLFIRYFPRVYEMKEDGSYILERGEWCAKDIIHDLFKEKKN